MRTVTRWWWGRRRGVWPSAANGAERGAEHAAEGHCSRISARQMCSRFWRWRGRSRGWLRRWLRMSWAKVEEAMRSAHFRLDSDPAYIRAKGRLDVERERSTAIHHPCCARNSEAKVLSQMMRYAVVVRPDSVRCGNSSTRSALKCVISISTVYGAETSTYRDPIWRAKSLRFSHP